MKFVCYKVKIIYDSNQLKLAEMYYSLQINTLQCLNEGIKKEI